jgi:hypothetical protein
VRDPLAVPIGVFPIDESGLGAQAVKLTAGTVWLFGPQLTSEAPAGSFCGFRIKSGALTLQGQVTVDVNLVVHIAADAVLTVNVTTDPPPAPTPAAGPGADMTSSVVTVPSTATIQFAPGGANVTALDPFGTTVYGTSVTLTGNSAAIQYDSVLKRVLLPADSSIATFAFATVQSALWTPSGAPAITNGAWALAISQQPAAQLGSASDAGSVALVLGPGVSAVWNGMGTPRDFSGGVLLVGPGSLNFSPTYNGPPFTQSLPLWNESSSGRRSSIDVVLGPGFSFLYFGLPGSEGIEIGNVTIKARLDRPLKVDAARIDFSNLPSQFSITQDGSGFHAKVIALPPPAGMNPFALALRNTLLEVNGLTGLQLLGTLDAGGVASGQLLIEFPLTSFLPTLPDPYITSFSAPFTVSNTPNLGATIAWVDVTAPQMAFGSPALSFSLGPPTHIIEGLRLLDVSTAADQLGVSFGQPDPNGASAGALIQGMDLSGTANGVSLLTLPEISWEPMFSDGSDGSAPGTIASQTDGRVGTMSIPNSVKLVPIAPALLVPPLLAEAKSGSLVDAEITLPFGIFASIRDPGAQYELVQPAFPNGLQGGLQIRFIPPLRLAPINLPPPDPGFDGSASTGDNPGANLTSYGDQVLGNTGGVKPAGIFNAQFINNVPIVRYDFCGYGASFFSDWRKSTPVGTEIIKAQFDVLVGRTSYEAVELQAFISPWGIRVIRTITIDRHNAGGVLRHDSGWQAASDGLLQLPGAGPFQVQAGPLSAVTAVHNIRDAGDTFTLDNVRHWGPITFDADFVLANGLTVTGGSAGTDRLASSGVTGYLVADAGVDATPSDINLLLTNRPASGSAAGLVSVAATGAQIRAAQMTVSCVMNGATAILVAALRGSPVLPAVGSWTVAKRVVVPGAPPVALDPRSPVPMIRNNADPAWHLAEPSDILNLGFPQNEYGLMQSTGTQKVYFPQPQMIPPAAPPPPGSPGPGFHMPQPPNLADVGALFNASGLFPDLRTALQFQGAAADLQASPDGVEIHGTIDTSAFVPRPLVDFGAVKVQIDYHDEKGVPANPKVDISPTGWSIDLGRVTFQLITPLGADPLLRIAANALASSNSAPALSNLNIMYGGALEPVENIFANLQQVAKFLPGGAGTELDIHFSGATLTIREVFSLPRLPLGAGFLKDIALDIGMTMSLLPPSLEFTSGIGSVEKPFNWLVSPLSGTGVVQVGVKDGDLAVLIQAGIGAGLSIDVGIAEGSASVVIALQVTITGSNLNLMVLLTAQASVDVLDGLASATLSLTAGLGVTPTPFPPRLPPSTKPLDSVTLSAAVGVGIHLTVCWLVHVDFDGYWQFSKTFDVPDIMSVIPV